MVNYKKLFTKYVDKWGFVGNYIHATKEVEVGDSSQRMGMIRCYEKWTGNEVLPYWNEEHIANQLLRPCPRRHPDPTRWPGWCGTLSFDNFFPMACASREYAKIVLPKLVKRLGFFWNKRDLRGKVKQFPITDLPRLKSFTALFRTLGWWWLYPILVTADLFLIPEVMFRVIYIKINPKHTSDELNTQILVQHSARTYPTPGSLIAFYLYYRFSDPLALRRYFRERQNMSPPPIHRLYEELWGRRD